MRIMVFFDLPTKTKAEKRAATLFRRFLLKDGYHKLQYSVYTRVCNGKDSVDTHRERLKGVLPPQGSIRLMEITEKQYRSIEVLLGDNSPDDEPLAEDQLTFF